MHQYFVILKPFFRIKEWGKAGIKRCKWDSNGGVRAQQNSVIGRSKCASSIPKRTFAKQIPGIEPSQGHTALENPLTGQQPRRCSSDPRP